jgi:endoglucanase
LTFRQHGPLIFQLPLELWDSGADDFNRPANTWNDPVTLDVWFNAASRITNTLADSTTDPQATSQITSASIFHKVGEVVYPQSITYLMDGNTLTSVKTSAGTALNSSQYSMPGGTLALSGTYLATLYKLDSAPGTEETLTLTFSTGTSLTLQIVQY